MLFVSCKHDEPIPNYSSFPSKVARIISTKCAVRGCHDNVSKDAVGGLSLESWTDLFNGYNNGPAVVPFRPDYSTFLFSINTFSDLGVQLAPTMPYNQQALTKDEVILLRDWIAGGAPDKNGKILFVDNSAREKIYLTNQGCDVVAVFDRTTGILMRYIDVGAKAGTESPHNIKMSPDKKYWYVIFTNGTIIQKYDASTDTYVGSATIGSGNWNTFTVSNDGTKGFAVDWSANGKVAYVDLKNMSLIQTWSGTMLFEYPHGSAINATDDTLYLTGQSGNFIYKVPVADPSSTIQVSLQTGMPPSTTASLNIHELIFNPDHSKYFVTCQFSNEVRIVNTKNDSVLKVIPTGNSPVEMSLSPSNGYLFVTCMEDTVFNPPGRGCVSIINYNTNTFIKNIYTGYQPHGIVVDETNNLVYVGNRNINPNGPAPHHVFFCGGRNGYVTYIDLTTLTMKKLGLNDKRTEVSVDPYSMTIR